MDQTSINSLEGWNQATEANNYISFMNTFFREPSSKEEVSEWVGGLLAKCVPAGDGLQDTKTDIVMIDGEVCRVRRLAL